MMHSKLRVYLHTPAGTGAVAVLRVEGPGACERVARWFRPVRGRGIESTSDDRPRFGRWLLAESVDTFAQGPSAASAEEVVVRKLADDCLEIHCHGGRAVVSVVTESLGVTAADLSPWTAWIERTEAEPIAAAARIALAQARTKRTAGILLDQYHGALANDIESILQALSAGDRQAALEQIEQLLDRAQVGLRLLSGWRVVLAGRPNVGKSSLINALVGYRRSLVYDLPGTTRDVVTVETALAGWPLELSDTAGLREEGERLESAGIARARAQLDRADLVVAVFDACAADLGCGLDLNQLSCPVLTVWNKSDLPGAQVSDDLSTVATSAQTGAGIAELMEAIPARVVPNPPPAGCAVPFTVAQREVLRTAHEMLRAGRTGDCERVLAALVRSAQ